MAEFIRFGKTYDPLTTLGLNEKIINIAEIVYITFYDKSSNKNVKSVTATVKLKNGEMFDVTESKQQIMKLFAVER